MPELQPTYGGQAVIEGVMMRGRRACAVAVRDPQGKVEVEQLELGSFSTSRLIEVPFLRGLVALWDALGLGVRALTYSANMQAESEEEKIEGGQLLLTFLISFSLALGVFFLLPAGAAFALERLLAWPGWLANLVEGLVRLGLLLGYIGGIGRFEDIRRVYGYHGAEHKTINAFEADDELTPAAVARYSREHPRCGTAFLLTVVLLSIVLFTALGPMDLLPRLASRLALIPLLASLAYEYLRLTARYADRAWMRPLLAPNLFIQRLTTREPDEEMLEVAIAAFQAMRNFEAREQPAEEKALAA